jgi:hypothetical protein
MTCRIQVVFGGRFRGAGSVVPGHSVVVELLGDFVGMSGRWFVVGMSGR